MLEDTKLASDLSCALNSVSEFPKDVIWHARLGHPHSRALNIMMPSISFKSDCEACILGKHCKYVFPKSMTIYDNCFYLVHSDVWTAPCASREQHKYFVTFINEKPKYTWIISLQSKDRVLKAFKNFQSYVTNHFHVKIKIFKSDNGGEYTSNAFKNHLATQGIIHQTSCPYTPQQNGVAERKNSHQMEVARSMMFHMNVPKRFWGDAVVTASYLINRIPTKVLHDVSPYEVLNKTKPSIDHLRVFGCVCFVLIPGELRKKLEPKSTNAMFIGYSPTQKGYKCYVLDTRKVLISRDVKFTESRGYYNEKSWNDLKDLSQSASDKASNLRRTLENLGISLPKENDARHDKFVEVTHLDPEGGNGTDVQQEEAQTEAGSDVHDVQQEETQTEAGSDVHDQLMRLLQKLKPNLRHHNKEMEERLIQYHNH